MPNSPENTPNQDDLPLETNDGAKLLESQEQNQNDPPQSESTNSNNDNDSDSDEIHDDRDTPLDLRTLATDLDSTTGNLGRLSRMSTLSNHSAKSIHSDHIGHSPHIHPSSSQTSSITHPIRFPNPAQAGPGYVPLSLALSRVPTLDDDGGTTTSSLSSYAGSAMSHEDESLTPSAYMTERITAAMNPGLLDRVVVVQAQTSGTINAKSLEIAELREKATKRMAELKITFSQGMKIAKQVAKDLDWANKHAK